jgi:hypothetical protein
VDVVVLVVELDELGLEVGVHRPHDFFQAFQMPVGEHLVSELRHEDRVSMQDRNQCLPVRMLPKSS